MSTIPGLFLNQLSLQNFATFKQQIVTFSAGFNAIVGETGSGKSLILDALQLAFGGRSDKKVVRKGAEYAVLEATLPFTVAEIGRWLDEEGYPSESNEVVIKRIIYKNGTSKSFINHQSCPLNVLIAFSRRYIDLVGQYENQKLLSDHYQLKLVDQYGESIGLFDEFSSALNKLKELQAQKQHLEQTQIERSQRMDYLEFQLDEIDRLNPTPDEEEKLIQIKNDYMNAEKKTAAISTMKNIFEGTDGEQGLLGLTRVAMSTVTKQAIYFPAGLTDKMAALDALIYEVSEEINRVPELEITEEELQAMVEKLDLYNKLKRKFGGTTEHIMEAREQFNSELSKLKAIDTDLSSILRQISVADRDCLELANKLHDKREASAKRLSIALTESVRSLKMNGADVKIVMEKTTEMTETGVSRIQFLAQTNPGEGYFRVKEIASGGELSRILLAVRQVLASQDSISVFLFDEIDTGMGGETALHIGKSLKRVATNSQVIAITHLPQIAAQSDKIVSVSKEIARTTEEGERTESLIREIMGEKAIKAEAEAMSPLH